MSKMQDYDKENKVPFGVKFGYLISSWVLVFLAGCFMFAIAAFAVGAFIKDTELASSQSTVQTLFLLILSNLILMSILWMRTVKRKDRNTYFLTRYSILGLWLGLFFTFILLSLSNMTQEESKNTNLTCSTLAEQRKKAINATYPIGTDQGTGTAFAVSSNGVLITADHVIDGAQKIYLNYATGEVPLQVIDRAPEFDIAVLKSPETTGDYLSLVDSYDQGDDLYALGYPRNTLEAGQASLSEGVLSRILSNEDLKLNEPSTPNGLEIVQTDTALNPGNSGGAIFNKCGVVGVVSAKSDTNQLQDYGISSEEGISFAISSKTVKGRFSQTIYPE
jgi:S1-C subfamily serine protease